MRLIKAKEAAEILNVRLPRLYELARTGVIPCVRFGEKSLRFNEPALQDFVERGGILQTNGSDGRDEEVAAA